MAAFAAIFLHNKGVNMKKYIMAFDAGTTSARTILFNKDGEIVSQASKEFTQYFPHPGCGAGPVSTRLSHRAGRARE